jgi:energy-coupling factor transport system substrate-specific component
MPVNGYDTQGGLAIMAQQVRAGNTKGRSNLWSVGTTDLIYIVVGSLLYGLFSWVSAGFKIPGPFNNFIRPGVAIPLFWGVAFGPIVGFCVGFFGNVLGDLLLGFGFESWNWSIGNGLMGLVAGLAGYYITRLNNARSIAIAVGFSLLGIVVGMGFGSITDIWFDGLTATQAWEEFYPVAVSNAISAIVLVPLLAIAYESMRTQTRAKA